MYINEYCKNYSPNTNDRLVYRDTDGELRKNCRICKHNYMCSSTQDCLQIMMERVYELEEDKQ